MTLPIDRRYAGIRIKKASGTTDRKHLRRLYGMLDVLASRHRLDILQSIADGDLSLGQVWDAFRRDGIDHLPTAETLRPLKATWERFVAGYEGSASHRQDLKYTSAAVLRHAPENATLEALPDALEGEVRELKARLQCPECDGRGWVGYSDSRDECPRCHGDKDRFVSGGMTE